MSRYCKPALLLFSFVNNLFLPFSCLLGFVSLWNSGVVSVFGFVLFYTLLGNNFKFTQIPYPLHPVPIISNILQYLFHFPPCHLYINVYTCLLVFFLDCSSAGRIHIIVWVCADMMQDKNIITLHPSMSGNQH